MEIYSVRASQSLNFKSDSGSTRTTQPIDIAEVKAADAHPSFDLETQNGGTPDFTSITPDELRSHALQSYQNGEISQDTYSTLASPLPTHAIDAMGNILDLSDVTDNTSFNFVDYYQNQLDVAASIGSPETAETLQSVVDFLKA